MRGRAVNGARPFGGSSSSKWDGFPRVSREGDRTPARIVRWLTAADPITFLLAVTLAAAISAGVFAHANRHGSRHATAWGVAAFLFAGITLPVYFVRYWARRRKQT